MLISVVVPLYNLKDTVESAVISVARQTYQSVEVVIVDDGSTDGSGKVADALAKQHSKVRVIHQKNQGLSAALNAGFEEARGDAYMVLSADDKLRPQALSHTSSLMTAKHADVVSSDMIANGQPVRCKPGSSEALRAGNCHHYAALFSSQLFKETGGFKTAMDPSWEDYEFWVSCAEAGAKWAHVSHPLLEYTPNSNGRSVEAYSKEPSLYGKLVGYHPKTFGEGRGLVTFVVPLFEQEQWVRHAVESALAQTYPHVKVVVVDDKSPTYDPQCLAGLECVVLRHVQNGGLAAARNTGISYAHNEWASQYFVCLDADDGVAPQFVEEVMDRLQAKRYAYCDVQFIGDANHTYLLEPFECRKMPKKHQHPCTFLAETQMWCDIVHTRGFGYDESAMMRVGFEDMEFAFACLEAGYCGQHVPGTLFEYRYHKNGSMRTRATQKKRELMAYIRSKHSWLRTKEEVVMACRGCGGGGASSVRASSAPGGGLPVGSPLMVTYLGNAGGRLTKLGRSGKIYRPNRDDRVFFIDEGDVNLFENGPFRVEAVPASSERVEEVAETAKAVAVQNIKATVGERVELAGEVFVEDLEPDEPEPPAPAPAPAPAPVVTPDPRPKVADRLQDLPGVGATSVRKLKAAKFTTFASIADAEAERLVRVLPKNADVEEVQAHARLLAVTRR